MTKVMEKILKSAILREVSGITSATVIEEKNISFIQTAGVNFNILNKLSFIDKINVNRVGSNDIQAMAKKYGVIYYYNLDISCKKYSNSRNCYTI